MAKTGYINARIEPTLKKQAERVLRGVGVNASDALTMFYKQVVIQQGLPFEVRVPNKKMRKAIADLRAGKGKVYKGTATEIFDAILKGR